ncbi:hypothetical protein S225a_25620 [Candidatus Brocadiaceae bacterium S225]|uniref:Uncharacterized protein n=1 Tax=Candidatus Scalindua brodae TaxID=237368 RepID=A0A0B0EKL7_9BACT|nr:MAG: hypothetical protein SCABRO_00644 [Candidatus Scalindua brodae]TWU29185.1 hypothetical protein S225a_25620 [Candidatus Brocadiaceae bacterium S225]
MRKTVAICITLFLSTYRKSSNLVYFSIISLPQNTLFNMTPETTNLNH